MGFQSVTDVPEIHVVMLDTREDTSEGQTFTGSETSGSTLL